MAVVDRRTALSPKSAQPRGGTKEKLFPSPKAKHDFWSHTNHSADTVHYEMPHTTRKGGTARRRGPSGGGPLNSQPHPQPVGSARFAPSTAYAAQGQPYPVQQSYQPQPMYHAQPLPPPPMGYPLHQRFDLDGNPYSNGRTPSLGPPSREASPVIFAPPPPPPFNYPSYGPATPGFRADYIPFPMSTPFAASTPARSYGSASLGPMSMNGFSSTSAGGPPSIPPPIASPIPQAARVSDSSSDDEDDEGEIVESSVELGEERHPEDDHGDDHANEHTHEHTNQYAEEHDHTASDSSDSSDSEEEVADSLVRRKSHSETEADYDRSMAPPPSSVPDDDQEADDDSDDAASDVSDIEEAVLERVADEDEVDPNETLPFEFESESESEDEDDHLTLDSDSQATVSRAASPHVEGPSDESVFIQQAVALSPPPPPPPQLPQAEPHLLTLSADSPQRLFFATTAKEDATRDVPDADEPEEGELVDAPVAAPAASVLPDEISETLSALRAAWDSNSNLLPHVQPPVRQQPVRILAPQPVVPKASYERKRPAVDLADATPPPAADASTAAVKRAKLSYKPSPLSKPAEQTTDPQRAVYVRRSERSQGGTPTPETAVAAPVKAAYQRRTDALVAMASNQASKGKLRGALPLTRDEKAERLPPKFYAAFGEYATIDQAKQPSLFATPKHTVLPARNLAPPNEAALFGFWPGPPTRKQASSKAIFPAPLISLADDAQDDRPRVDVFIDNSNVLYSFLNWVRGRSDAKVMSVKAPGGGKDAQGNAKTVKTVTVAGKKVKLDYRALFAVLERGRKVERRVIVGSSTLWQSLEPAIEWGYEISLLQRVPRAEAPKGPYLVANGKKRGGNNNNNGKGKEPAPTPAASQVKHYKEQAVDELVHLKILESLLDYTPTPLIAPSRPATPEATVVANAIAIPTAIEGASAEPPIVAEAPTTTAISDATPSAPVTAPEVASTEVTPAANTAPANRFQPSAAFLSNSTTGTTTAVAESKADAKSASSAPAPKPADPRFIPAGSKRPVPPPKNPSIVRIVPRTPPRDRPVLVIGTGDANSSEYNPGGFLGCVRRALDRGWDVEIAAFTSGISSLWTGEQMKRFTDDGRPRGELRVIDLALFGEELVTV